jgi:hypothetical protein
MMPATVVVLVGGGAAWKAERSLSATASNPVMDGGDFGLAGRFAPEEEEAGTAAATVEPAVMVTGDDMVFYQCSAAAAIVVEW